MLVGNGLFDAQRKRIDLVVRHLSIDFLSDDQFFCVVAVDRERGAVPGAHQRIDRLHGELDVLRRDVRTADDDEILDAPGDIQLPVMQEAQISGAQITTVGTCVGGRHRERLRNGLRVPPIALSNAWAAHPDLADLIGARDSAGFGLHDQNFGCRQGSAAADQFMGVRSCGAADFSAAQGLCIEAGDADSGAE